MKMRKSITPNQIKETNRTLIYQYIYKKKNRVKGFPFFADS